MNKIVLLILVIVLIAGGLVYLQNKSTTIPTSQTTDTNKTQSASPASSEQTKKFQSSNVLKFSIILPNTYEIEEKFGSVNISTSKGKILISQNGTNFENLKDYIKNSRNNLETRIQNKNTLEINGMESIFGNIDREKVYLIYKDYTVYSLSTSSESLYDDLDQIAQSFRYAP